MTDSLKLKLGLAICATVLLSVCAFVLLPPSGAPGTRVIPTDASTSPAATTDEAIAKCDTLASHPHDPDRYTPGVTDEQFAPGAAIAACKKAVAANPDFPRIQFQLGRAYWLANRDADAFQAFLKAAQRGYAPAIKFIGDAYNEGRGLPQGETQSLQNAIELYKKSAAGGFKDAATALQEANTLLAASRLNASLFQNPTYITKIYNGDFATIDNPIMFIAYVKAFADELGGTNVFFIDQQCTGMVTALGGAVLSVQQIIASLNALQGQNGLANFFVSSIFSSFTQDQGKRDAVTLMSNYTCKSPVTKKIVDHVIGSYKELPTIMNATLGKGQNPPSTTPKTPATADIRLSKEEIEPLRWSVIAGDCSGKSTPACEKISSLMRDASFDIIYCIYPQRGFHFWHNKVPENILSYEVVSGQLVHPFAILGKISVNKCPETISGAETIYRLSRLSY